MLARQFGFLVRTHRPDYRYAKTAGPLARHQPHTTGSRMEQNSVTRADRDGLAK